MTVTVFPEERALLVETSDPWLMLQKVPSAFQLSPTLVGMPHGVDEVTRLAAYLHVAAPSPIEYYYDWPCDPVLFKSVFAHQKITAGFLTSNPRSYCLNGIGTMKTITALWAADFLLREGIIPRVLIIAPIEALVRAWADTIFFHLRHRKCLVLHGTAKKRHALLQQDVDFYILNPDGLPIMEKALAARDDLSLYIIDELADFRNKHNAWKALERLLYPAKRAPVPWVWGLGATPMPTSPLDVYHQCRLVTPNTVPKFYSQFRPLVMEQQSQYVWTPRPEALDIVYQVMRPAIRFKRDDCLDLPGEIFTTYDVTLSAEQTKHYKEIMRDLYSEVRGAKVTAMNEGIKLSKLLQIACGVVYDTAGNPVEIDAGSRIEVLLSMIERINEKVIVFVPFTEVTNMLHREISKHWSCAVVYGGVSRTVRDQIFSDFQAKPDPSVLIAHPECMARSLTLTEASTVIWYAPISSNYIYEQANGRITRQGQKYVANIIHLAGSAVERKAYKRLETRQKLQGVLLEMVEKGEQ